MIQYLTFQRQPDCLFPAEFATNPGKMGGSLTANLCGNDILGLCFSTPDPIVILRKLQLLAQAHIFSNHVKVFGSAHTPCIAQAVFEHQGKGQLVHSYPR